MSALPCRAQDIRTILQDLKQRARVGCPAQWNRSSYFAMKYLQGRTYPGILVNPCFAGEKILGGI